MRENEFSGSTPSWWTPPQVTLTWVNSPPEPITEEDWLAAFRPAVRVLLEYRWVSVTPVAGVPAQERWEGEGMKARMQRLPFRAHESLSACEGCLWEGIDCDFPDAELDDVTVIQCDIANLLAGRESSFPGQEGGE